MERDNEKRDLEEFSGDMIWDLMDVWFINLDKDNKRKADLMAAETEEKQRKEEQLKNSWGWSLIW